MGVPAAKLKERSEALHEFNPMLGHRGVRLTITYPEIAEMQARAIFEAAVLVKKEAGIEKGSGQPNRNKVGKVTWDDVRKIAEIKMPDLNCFTIESAMSMVAGTARSMGITVEGQRPF